MSELFQVARPCSPVSGCDAVFPVHRIYCVGQNYAAHAREMGGDAQLMAAIITATTLISFITMPIAISLVLH